MHRDHNHRATEQQSNREFGVRQKILEKQGGAVFQRRYGLLLYVPGCSQRSENRRCHFMNQRFFFLDAVFGLELSSHVSSPQKTLSAKKSSAQLTVQKISQRDEDVSSEGVRPEVNCNPVSLSKTGVLCPLNSK
jgi:hypothetical protein